jgi:HEAT repeat protein/beta-lactamase regulating signal transducer with metallopeptidase domain
LLAAPAVATVPVVAAVVPAPLRQPAGPADAVSVDDSTRARTTPDSPASIDPGPPLTATTEISWMAAALAVWIAGLTMTLARLAAGLAWVSRITREAADVEDADWRELLDELAAAFSIRAPVALKIGSDATIPVTGGIWSPAILLPPTAAEWPEARRRVVLLHELAHVARRDCLVRTIAELVRALYWFNPLAHLAAARLRAEQERAADDLVLAAGTDAPVYADHLFEIARTFRSEPFPQWATLAMARPSNLEGRVMDILDDHRNRRPLARGVRAAVAGSAAALILPIGALQVTAAARPADPEALSVIADDERATSNAAADRIESAPATVMAFEAPALARPDAPVNAAGQSADAEPGVDVDVDVDVDPTPVPHPHPEPHSRVPWMPELWSHFRMNDGGLQSQSRSQSQSQSQSQSSPETPVSDETRRRVADALLTALNDENENVRVQALSALASMRDPRAIPGLVKAARDASVEVREQALTALAQFDTPEATQAILAALKDQSPDVRERAARLVAALASRGGMNDPKNVAVLSDLLKDTTPDIRVQAIVALGRLRRPDAVPALLPMLKDMNAEVREQAAVALGAIADPAAITALTAALKDPQPEVREQATRALGRIARGQQRANPVGLPPVPPVPPVSPVLPVPPVPPVPLTTPPGPPQVNLDTEAIRRAAEQIREMLQRELPSLRLHQQALQGQQEEIERQAEELTREAERLLR